MHHTYTSEVSCPAREILHHISMSSKLSHLHENSPTRRDISDVPGAASARNTIVPSYRVTRKIIRATRQLMPISTLHSQAEKAATVRRWFYKVTPYRPPRAKRTSHLNETASEQRGTAHLIRARGQSCPCEHTAGAKFSWMLPPPTTTKSGIYEPDARVTDSFWRERAVARERERERKGRRARLNIFRYFSCAELRRAHIRIRRRCTGLRRFLSARERLTLIRPGRNFYFSRKRVPWMIATCARRVAFRGISPRFRIERTESFGNVRSFEFRIRKMRVMGVLWILKGF